LQSLHGVAAPLTAPATGALLTRLFSNLELPGQAGSTETRCPFHGR